MNLEGAIALKEAENGSLDGVRSLYPLPFSAHRACPSGVSDSFQASSSIHNSENETI